MWKTTLAQAVGKKMKCHYYNWDIAKDRKQLLAGELDPDTKLWIFDELHKNRRWRNWLKGLFDEYQKQHAILVTGSARLDLYGRGGDSLQGRYFMHRLHPFTLSEISGRRFSKKRDWMAGLEEKRPVAERASLNDLCQLGGFPEPFLSGSEKQADRWRLGYGARLVREEIRSVEGTQDLDRMELLFDRLTQTVGSPLSLNSLREDVEVAHGTIKNWISIFERLYGVFRVLPFGPPKIKAVKKETKLYFWDWAKVGDPSARFENLVAVHLLRFTHWLEDVEGQQAELRYFRSERGQEVDFILLIKKKPLLAVEVKIGDRPLDKNLKYLMERIDIPLALQISLKGEKDYQAPSIQGNRIRVLPAARFLGNLP